MIRKFVSFPIADPQQVKAKMLNWGNRFNICCFLDNHQYDLGHSSLECILAAGAISSVSEPAGAALSVFQQFLDESDDWLFGHFGYDLKNEIESLSSAHSDRLHFPDLFFFVPELVVQLSNESIMIGSCQEDHEHILKQILESPVAMHKSSAVTISHQYTKDEYVAIVEELREHIHAGDCYEINFCQEFFAEDADIDPLSLYMSLSAFSPNPFSAFYKIDDRYLVCLSPERYLKKTGSTIMSQPMKGTSRRTGSDEAESRRHLQHDAKERAENIMIVDLVRNDLSKICRQGSVKVDELCAVYTFPQVYQMVSTVSGELRDDVCASDAIAASFPMGSMTGAPKKRVMELIERYEGSRRGLFSGSLGYFTPEGDFDLNVVIRSVLYNSSERYLSFHTGSAITFSSDAETEYRECLLKAEAMQRALI